MTNVTETKRALQFGDVIQIKSDENIPKEIVGCLGYVVDSSSTAAIKFRLYLPKTIGDWAEYTEYILPEIALTFVGVVPEDMQPII